MGRGLQPDHFFNSAHNITPAFLLAHGTRGVILDIDNTLVFYGVHHPTGENIAWIESLTGAGLQVAFVSNGYRERVEEYNVDFGFYMSHKSGKPKPQGFLLAARHMGLAPEQVAVVGDQIFTDIWGGNNAGMLTLLVRPIQPEPWLRFKVKRALERPITRRLKPYDSPNPHDEGERT